MTEYKQKKHNGNKNNKPNHITYWLWIEHWHNSIYQYNSKALVTNAPHAIKYTALCHLFSLRTSFYLLMLIFQPTHTHTNPSQTWVTVEYLQAKGTCGLCYERNACWAQLTSSAVLSSGRRRSGWPAGLDHGRRASFLLACRPPLLLSSLTSSCAY